MSRSTHRCTRCLLPLARRQNGVLVFLVKPEKAEGGWVTFLCCGREIKLRLPVQNREAA